jgi:hypothetical protein
LFPACVTAPDDTDTDTTSELAVALPIAKATNSMIVGSSSDRRWVVYATECGTDDTRLELYDTLTTLTTELGRGLPCQPGGIQFSPDGLLVAFGDGFGHVQVHSAVWQRTVSVSRDGLSTIGIVWSPTSQWFVVASADATQPLGATLDAWDATLATPTKIADHAFFSPFGPGPANVEFSPDGARLLYLGDVEAPPYSGTLKIWHRATATASTLATDVAIAGYAVRADWKYVAYLRDAVATTSGSPDSSGNLVLRNLITNATRTLETAKVARPMGFANETLLYTVATAPNDPFILRAHDAVTALTATLDSGVVAGFRPNIVAISADGSRVAYTRNFDASAYAAELRVARTTPPFTATTVDAHAIPFNAYGWVGSSLAYLHDASATFPGAAIATLSVWSGQSARTIARDVSEIGLRFDGSDLLFLDDYNMAAATGDLRVYSALTNSTRLVGQDAWAMSIQRNAVNAGYLQVMPATDPSAPPATRLRISRLFGVPHNVLVSPKSVSSFALGYLGRVIYATDDGVYDALAL